MKNMFYDEFEVMDEELQEEEFTWEDAMDLFFPNAKDEREVEDELEDIWNE